MEPVWIAFLTGATFGAILCAALTLWIIDKTLK